MVFERIKTATKRAIKIVVKNKRRIASAIATKGRSEISAVSSIISKVTKAPTAMEIITRPTNLKAGESKPISKREVEILREGLASGAIPRVSSRRSDGGLSTPTPNAPHDIIQAQRTILKEATQTEGLSILAGHQIEPVVIAEFRTDNPTLQTEIDNALRPKPTMTESIFGNLGSAVGAGIKNATEPIKPLVYLGIGIAALALLKK